MKFSEVKTGEFFHYEGQAYMKMVAKHSITYNCVTMGGDSQGLAYNIYKDVDVGIISEALMFDEKQYAKKVETAFMRFNGGFWFRIFGYGLRIKDTIKHPLLFSDRTSPKLRIGKWQIKLLRRN